MFQLPFLTDSPMRPVPPAKYQLVNIYID